MRAKVKKEETYNSWTNYETWNVALWIGVVNEISMASWFQRFLEAFRL